MILFGIMGFAALVIDIGFARLTSRQMKQAADIAALEGLRVTDVDAASPQTFAGRDAVTETGRRQVAADIVTILFDDDFDTADDVRNFGAGPQVTLTGGIALDDEFNASELLSLPDPPVYKPNLQLNAANEPDGDIVTQDESLTVRLRRDSTVVRANEVSNGGPIPFLFGRGTLMSSGRKASGVSLEVTSTAETQPVVRVGIRQMINGVQTVEIPGGIRFGISRAIWESLPANLPTTVPMVANSVGAASIDLLEIGQLAVLVPAPLDADGYCPIIESIAGTPRVIGFGWAAVTSDPANIANVILTRHSDGSATETVASENATALRSAAWNSLAGLGSSDRDAVINANRTFAGPLVSAVLRSGESL